MEQKEIRYPLSTQWFEDLITEGYVYIDKTEYVYKMTHSDSQYVFLSRPRRFGKSLLVSTLRSYFEGKKELFEGLAIEKLEKDWVQHPVLHFSMASAKHLCKEDLEAYLNYILNNNAERLGLADVAGKPNLGLLQLTEAAYKKYGKKVVILIDEYDAPLLDVVHEDDNLKELRQTMRNFYSPLKDLGPMLRFTFLTGITKFSQLSIFSELNNLKKISMLENYAGVCGITEEEMLTQLKPGIEALAQKRGISYSEAVAALKESYDGYHFTWPSPDVYNPFSLLNALADKAIDNYWFGSGTPSYLQEMMRKFRLPVTSLFEPMVAVKEDFDAPTEGMTGLEPLFYQSGYITIKDCSPSGLYTLGIPNKEVRIGLLRSLIPHYLGVPSVRLNATSARMQDALLQDDIESFMQLLQTFIGTLPGADYVDKPEHYEAHWQRVLTVIFSLLGATVAVEVRTHKGRIDLEARTAQKIYLVELKMGDTTDEAMNQIEENDYTGHYALSGLPVVKVAANFSEEEKNITGWKVGHAADIR